QGRRVQPRPAQPLCDEARPDGRTGLCRGLRVAAQRGGAAETSGERPMSRAALRSYVVRDSPLPQLRRFTVTANSSGDFVRANGIDIHYVQAGEGDALILLHGGMVSTNPIWAPTPVSYAGHMATLARRYRVIAPDTRGCGRTVHDGGIVTFDQLADDVIALAGALELDRPLIAGFSEGAITATIAGIRAPDLFRAIVNDAGYDAFNPQAASFTMLRPIL